MRNKGLRNKFLKWEDNFESKGLKVNLVKAKEEERGNLRRLVAIKYGFGS